MSPAVHQLYYTHCSHATSAITRGTGAAANRGFEYTVRAASLPQSELRECLQDLEPLLRYELPQELPSSERHLLTARTAPQRLIYGRTARGRNIVALISYRPYDLARRPGSLFAHVLLPDPPSADFSPLECLSLWGAPGWVVEDSDSIPHDLPPLSELSDLHGGQRPLVDDEALLDFLLAAPAACPDIVPQRWRDRPAAERRLLFLQGLAHFLFPQRSPVHFLAEPAFATLLFYGLLRLSKSSWIPPDLTWSTFEPWPPRRLPTLSAQSVFDNPPDSRTTERFHRIAKLVSTFADTDDPILTLTRLESPYFSGDDLEAGARARGSVAEWIGKLQEAARLAVANIAERNEPVSPLPPPPPPVVASSTSRSPQTPPLRGPKAPGAGRAPPDATVAPPPWADLVEAIERNDEEEFWRHFDVRMVRTHCDALRPFHDSIRKFVAARITSGKDMLPALPRVTNPITLGRSGEFVFRWIWPTVRLVDHCILALTEAAPAGTTPPEDNQLITKHVVARKHYELSSGFRVPLTTIPTKGHWSVWGVVDLGFTTLTGGCLVLGEAAIQMSPVRLPSPGRTSPLAFWRSGLARLFAPFTSVRPVEARVCPRCGGVSTRHREVRRDWICDDCDHRWSGQRSVAAAFISYRREGASEIARAIRSELLRRGIATFLDVDDLRSHYYDERLLREIEAAPNFLLILSPGCLDRCVDPEDWLRKEVVHAMRHGRNIVPVLTQGFDFPRPAELTAELRDLPRYNCVEYSHAYFSATIQKLVDFMKLA